MPVKQGFEAANQNDVGGVTGAQRNEVDMSKAMAGIYAAAFLTAMAGAASPARAEIVYPWCVFYAQEDGGIDSCGFTTYAQCKATLSGQNGYCHENLAFSPAKPKSKKSSAQRR